MELDSGLLENLVVAISWQLGPIGLYRDCPNYPTEGIGAGRSRRTTLLQNSRPKTTPKAQDGEKALLDRPSWATRERERGANQTFWATVINSRGTKTGG